MNTIVHALLEQAEAAPGSLAYAFEGAELTHGALATDARRLAHVLAGRGVGPGTACALVLPTSLDLVRAILAVQLAGAAPLVVNPALPPLAVAARARLARCVLALAPRATLAALEAASGPALPLLAIEDALAAAAGLPLAAPLATPEAPGLLMLTSGTSGEPRVAVLSHRNILANMRSSAARLEVARDDVFVCQLPLHYSLGLVRLVLGPLVPGCPVHLVEPSAMGVRAWLETISRVRATITGAPDFAYRAAATLVSAASVDLRSLRCAVSAGDPIRLATIDAFEKRFGTPGVLRPGYGLAEGGGVTGLGPGEPLRTDASGAVACGRAMPGLEVVVAGPDGAALPPGEPGEIRVRGEQVFAGYLGDDEATRAALEGGWLHTGDTGRFDALGHLYVLGRTRTVLKRGGALVVPGELEAAAEREPGIARAAAIGLRRAGAAEGIALVAEVSEPAPEPAALEALARATGERVARESGVPPNEVLLVRPGGLPRTATGKVRHDELRKALESGDPVVRAAVLFGRA